MIRVYLILALIICSLTSQAQALHTTDAASDFNRGKTMFIEENYSGCLDVMQLLLRRDDAKQYHQEAAFLVVMSQAHRDIDRTPSLLLEYLHQYPYSTHRHDIYLALGDYYYRTAHYNDALEYYLKININNIPQSKQDTYTYRMAFCHIKTGNTQAAQTLFHSLAQNSSQYRNEARYYEGYIYYENKDYKNTRRCLSLVPSNSEYGFEAQYIITNINFIEKRYATAIAMSEKLLKESTNNNHTEQLHRIAGESHYQLGNDAKAESHLDAYLSLDDQPMRNTQYMAGIIAFRNGLYDKAIGLLYPVTEATDDIAQNALLHIGLSYIQLGEKNKAMTAFEQSAASDCDNSVREIALYNYALCAYENEYSFFDHTISVFQGFLDEYPGSIYADDINSRLSDLHITSRNYENALQYIERINDPSPEILRQKQQILYLLGTEAFANNHITEAGKWFTEAIEAGNHAPEYRARAIYWLGECCYRKDAYKEALKCYNRFLNDDVTTDNTTVALAHYGKAYSLFELNEYDKALTAFDHFTKLQETPNALTTDAYNRIGDCHYAARQYNTAIKYYSKAAESKTSGSDYATLQQAIIAGVRKKNNDKISLLNTLITDYPQSEYNEEAYNELGQTYIALNKPSEAIDTYRQLMVNHPHSTSARKALLQLGALYYNEDNIDNSIEAYKALIEQHPASNEARVAADDLKSIYIELNKVNELSAFMQQQGYKYQTNELDSLTYLAAEHKYMNNAETAPLEEYLLQYPQGKYVANASFYLGNVADAQQDENNALAHYLNSLQANPDSDFAEDALSRCSDLQYNLRQFDKAYNSYIQLESIATTSDTRQSARLGAMRCCAILGNNNEAINIADRLLANEKLSPELRQEALYCRATAYMALGDSLAAQHDYTMLANDTRNEYGAEGAFRAAEYLFLQGNISEAETAANNFVKQGTPHAYWLARTFILLSDINKAKGEIFTAEQYLLQLQDSYPGENDDITTIINEKLQALQPNS